MISLGIGGSRTEKMRRLGEKKEGPSPGGFFLLSSWADNKGALRHEGGGVLRKGNSQKKEYVSIPSISAVNGRVENRGVGKRGNQDSESSQKKKTGLGKEI